MVECYCLGCKKEYQDKGEYPSYASDGDVVETSTICTDCRRHIAIGRAVEGMPAGAFLFRHGLEEWGYDAPSGESITVDEKTPLEALTKGGKHGG